MLIAEICTAQFHGQKKINMKMTEFELQKLCGLIQESLESAKMQHQVDEECGGFPLVDFLSTGTTIDTGLDEIENITEHIYHDLFEAYGLPERSISDLLAIGGNWVELKFAQPDTSIYGDGNTCIVQVKTERGLVGEALYGTSGAPGESNGFFNSIRTSAGDVTMSEGNDVVMWKYLPLPGSRN